MAATRVRYSIVDKGGLLKHGGINYPGIPTASAYLDTLLYVGPTLGVDASNHVSIGEFTQAKRSREFI